MFQSDYNSWFNIVGKIEEDNKHDTYEKFIENIKSQIKRKTQAISNGKKCFDNKYTLDDMKIVLEKHVYDKLPKNESDYYCFLTFHSTGNVSKINSICKYGYIIPGTQHPTLGWTLNMACGNVYGDGIYSSPNFVTSSWYSFLDHNKSIQVIINIVYPGRVKTVDPNNCYYEHYKNDYNFKDTSRSIPEHQEYFYKDSLGEYDTLMSEDKTIIVSGNKDMIIPVAIITMIPIPEEIDKKLTMIIGKKNTKIIKATDIKLQDEMTKFSFDNTDMLTVTNIMGEYNAINLKNHLKKTNLEKRHILCIPYIYSIEKEFVTFRESLNNFTLALEENSQKIVYYYGNTQKSKTITNNFMEFTNNIPYIGREEKVFDCLTKVFDLVLKNNSSEQEYLNVVYLVVNKPTDHTELNKIYEYVITQKFVLKVIFLDKIVKEICKVKTLYQNVSFFESYYHEIKPNMFGELVDILLDENTNLEENAKYYNTIKTSFPYGLIGQGFVESFNSQPVWDHYAQTNSVIYKGYSPYITIGWDRYSTQFLDKNAIQNKESNENYYKCLYDRYIEAIKNKDLFNTEMEKIKIELMEKEKEITLLNERIKISNIYREKNEQTLYRFHEIASTEIYKAVSEMEIKISENDKKILDLNEHISDYDDIKQLHSALTPLIAKFRNFVYVYPSRCKTHCKFIVDLCETFIKKLNNYPRQDDDQCKERYFFEQMYPSLSLRKTIRMQLQKLLSDIVAFSKVKFTGKWLNKLMNMKFGKKVTKRVKTSFNLNDVKQLVNIPDGVKINEIEDLFSFVNKTGLLIKTRQSGASEIEPWNIVVEYVSSDKSTFNKLFISNECGNDMRDKKERLVNNLLLDNDDDLNKFDEITKLCYGYIFTKIPQLYLPSQNLALLVNTWLSSLEKIYKIMFIKSAKKETYNRDNVFEKFCESVELFKRVQRFSNKNQELQILQKNIFSSNIFDNTVEKYLTTKNNITSLSKVLGSLTIDSDDQNNFKNKEYYVSEEYHRLCFSLLVESVIRSCHSMCVTTKMTAEKCILNILNIDIKTNLNNWELSKETILKGVFKTNKFFTRSYTNCSLFTIVSVMGFLKYHYLGETSEKIFSRFENGDISTKQFLSDHLKNSKGRLTQLGLFLFGMKYSDYSKPDNVYFDDPKKIIKDISDEYIQIIKRRQRVISSITEKAQNRLLKRLENAEPYKNYHTGCPTIFKSHEVDEINKSRAKEDQLIITESGLLKYHCCYPNCPMYLKNLALDCSNPKYALINHLQQDILLDNYTKGFHKNGKYMVKWSDTFDQFTEKMNKMYENNESYKKANNINETLYDIWCKFKTNQQKNMLVV